MIRVSRLKISLTIVPANLVGEAGGAAEVDQVSAATDEYVLQVDHLVERGMQVGVCATADVGAALQHGDLRAAFGQGDRRVQPGNPCPYYGDVAIRLAHPVTRFHTAITAPRARIPSFSAVEMPTRSRKTSILRSAIRPSSR